jgi:hypothetical protein
MTTTATPAADPGLTGSIVDAIDKLTRVRQARHLGCAASA